MDARVFISPETMAKANQPLTARQKSQLRIKRLYEAAENGDLAKAKTKAEVGLFCGGYSAKETANAMAWTAYLIKKGVLIERLSGRNPYTGFPEYEYSLAEKSKEPNPLKEQMKVVEPRMAQYENGTGITVQIKKNDITINFEKLDVARATELTLAVLKA